MDTQRIINMISDAIELYQNEEDDELINRISTFKEAGILSNDDGLVLYLNDGKEFQVTIVRSN